MSLLFELGFEKVADGVFILHVSSVELLGSVIDNGIFFHFEGNITYAMDNFLVNSEAI